MGDETASPRKRRDKSRAEPGFATLTGSEEASRTPARRPKLWGLYDDKRASSRHRSKERRRSKDKSPRGKSRPAAPIERDASRAAHRKRRARSEKRERSTPSKRQDSARLAEARKLPPKEMFAAIAGEDAEEVRQPTSPVTASQEVLMSSPENIPDALAEELMSTELQPVEEDPSLAIEREAPPPGSHQVADMPPPAQGTDHFAIQDISDIPAYVQDRLADAWAAAGIAAPEGEDSAWDQAHDRRLCNNLQFPP